LKGTEGEAHFRAMSSLPLMKTILSFTRLFTSLTALALLMLTVPRARAEMSTEVFYDALDPYGDWIKTDDYGYAFHPRDVGEDWRPYTDGNWAYTDAGWTFVSDEPFAWATYHYGRWANVESIGWMWVPDTEWGPAWVSWRRSNDYVGWSPLPPEARFERKTGFHAWVDSNYDIGPTNYSFVRVRDLGAPRLRTVIVQPRENITIIRETRNITNVTYVNNVVINNGPDYDVVVRESAQPIRRLRLERSQDFNDPAAFRDGRARSTVSGDTLRIAAPALTAVAQSVAPRKVARTVTNAQVNRGWRDAGPAEQVQQARAAIAAEPKAPASVQAATKIRASAATSQPTSAATNQPTSTATTQPNAKTSAAASSESTATTPAAATPAASTPTARTAEVPAATPASKKPAKPGKTERTATSEPAKPTSPAASTDAPAAPASKAATAREKGRSQKPDGATGEAPAAIANTPEDRPPTRQKAPGNPISPGSSAAAAPHAKRGPAVENAPTESPSAERSAPIARPSVDAPAPSEGARMKGPKINRPEPAAPAPSPERAVPSEPKASAPAGRERPQSHAPVAPQGQPDAAAHPPTTAKPGAKPGKGEPAEDGKKKKEDAPQ
jgi:hypothetical protein